MEKLLKLFILFLTICCLASCGKKNRKTNNDNNNSTRENVTVNDKELQKNLLFARDIAANQDTFSRVEMKFNLKLTSPQQNLSVSGNMRIAYDSVIWLNVTMMGIEGVRAKLTPDSVKLIVPIKKKYFKGDYSYLKTVFPLDVDFYTVQNLFLDRFFLFPKNDVSLINNYFSASQDNNSLKLFSNDNYEKEFLVSQDITINTTNKKVEKNVLTMPSQNRDLTILYSAFTENSSHLLPYNIEFKTGDGLITFNYTRVIYGKKTTYPFNIPANYSPMQ